MEIDKCINNDTIIHHLGVIEGELKGIKRDVSHVQDSVDGLDERMRAVETRTAVSSGVIATAVAAGVSGIAHALGVPRVDG